MTRPTAAALAFAALLTLALTPAALALDSVGGDEPRGSHGGQRCALYSVSPSRSSAGDCLGCHTQREHASHPVEVDYAGARQRGGMMARDLRQPAELARRGVRLVEGRVTCVTCHDAHSPAAYRIALPADGSVVEAVDVHDRAHLARPALAQRLSALPEGSAVSPTTLCKACHGLD